MLSRTPETHVCDTKICRRACIKDDWAKHDEHENIEKKVDIFHNLNGILAKTRNLIYEKKTKQCCFLVNKSDAAKRLSSKTTWFRRIQFLEMHHIINSCTSKTKIYGKDAKSYTLWSFPSYREDEIHWETCWHVWQICRVYKNSLNADTVTQLDFTKIVPTKFHLWFCTSQFLIYPLVWWPLFSRKTNNCLMQMLHA